LTPPPTVLHWPSGGGSWDPLQLSALAAWYKADSLTGVNDGDSVASLLDSSGIGNNLTVHDVNNTPVVRTNAQNGLNIIEWRNAATELKNTSSSVFQNVSGISRAIVYRQPGTATMNADAVSESGVSDQRFFHQLTFSNTIYNRIKRRHLDSYNPALGISHGAASANTWYIQVDFADFSVPSGSGTLDGVSGGNHTLTSGNTASASTAVFLGGLLGTGYDVDIAESVYVNAVVSTADRERLEGYLAHKWGLTANLPSSHPYKSSAP
jgi:hypothetical protein